MAFFLHLNIELSGKVPGELGRHHRIKNRILLKRHHLPGDLKTNIAILVDDYNRLGYPNSIDNLAPNAQFGEIRRSSDGAKLGQDTGDETITVPQGGYSTGIPT